MPDYRCYYFILEHFLFYNSVSFRFVLFTSHLELLFIVCINVACILNSIYDIPHSIHTHSLVHLQLQPFLFPFLLHSYKINSITFESADMLIVNLNGNGNVIASIRTDAAIGIHKISVGAYFKCLEINTAYCSCTKR